jgi:hypothetical protein
LRSLALLYASDRIDDGGLADIVLPDEGSHPLIKLYIQAVLSLTELPEILDF